MPGTATIAWDDANFTLDTDAQAFLTATGITDYIITFAINDLVLDAKANGWWTLCDAIYPFVGGTATTHKYNLKNPADSNAAFRLVFTGGWQHSATGALPNGTTGYADTFLVPNTTMNLNDSHLSFYSRSNTSGAVTFRTEMCSSAGGGGQPSFSMAVKTQDTQNSRVECCIGDTAIAGGAVDFFPNNDSMGYYMLSRTTSTLMVLYRNGSNLSQNTSAQGSVTKPTATMVIGCANQAGTKNSFTDKEFSFSTIGDGVSSGLASTMYTDVQVFQTKLGRNV